MKSAVSSALKMPPAPEQLPPLEPSLITFPAGIPGFEMCRRFVLVDSDELTPLRCLQTLDPPQASFLTIDPCLIDPDYDLVLSEHEQARLGIGAGPLVWLAIVALSPAGATVNLQAPVVIDAGRMVGGQIIRDDTRYPVHFPIGAS
jgi:flagellar assembly factor FliW